MTKIEIDKIGKAAAKKTTKKEEVKETKKVEKVKAPVAKKKAISTKKIYNKKEIS